MLVPRELDKIKAELESARAMVDDALHILEYLRVGNSSLDRFSSDFYEVDLKLRNMLEAFSNTQERLKELFFSIENWHPPIKHIVYFGDGSSLSEYGTASELADKYPAAIDIREA